ncbi:MAG: ECF-type sigma factor [Planctomycetota bacterium]|jgi:RNA polymerase sigma factor (TIGR02999 family)
MSRAREESTSAPANVGCGDPESAGQLMPIVYDELRDLASAYLRRERRDHTLEPTALVHEAYLKLMNGAAVEIKSRTHFLAVAARGMKQVLVDHARKRHAAKRGGAWHQITLSGAVAVTDDGTVDPAVLPDVLAALARQDERAAEIVQLRFFGGLTIAEVAEVLEIPIQTADREWRHARAWLRKRLVEEIAR